MEMKRMTITEFADLLASDAPAPGGGTVAALCSALSASLSSMVFSLTIGKKMYNEYDEAIKNKMNEWLAAGNNLKEEFQQLMDTDTEAFNLVMAAFKLPKDTEEEKAARSIKIQEGYVKAMEVPLSVAKKTVEIFEMLEFAAQYGNPNAASDAGVGALLAYAAIEGAVLNVKINLGSIKNAEMVEAAAKDCEDLIRIAREKKDAILATVNSKI